MRSKNQQPKPQARQARIGICDRRVSLGPFRRAFAPGCPNAPAIRHARNRYPGAQAVKREALGEVCGELTWAIDEKAIASRDNKEIEKDFALWRQEPGETSLTLGQALNIICKDALKKARTVFACDFQYASIRKKCGVGAHRLSDQDKTLYVLNHSTILFHASTAALSCSLDGSPRGKHGARPDRF